MQNNYLFAPVSHLFSYLFTTLTIISFYCIDGEDNNGNNSNKHY